MLSRLNMGDEVLINDQSMIKQGKRANVTLWKYNTIPALVCKKSHKKTLFQEEVAALKKVLLLLVYTLNVVLATRHAT